MLIGFDYSFGDGMGEDGPLIAARPGQNFLSMDGFGRMDAMRSAPGHFCAGWITQKWHRFHRKRVRIRLSMPIFGGTGRYVVRASRT